MCILWLDVLLPIFIDNANHNCFGSIDDIFAISYRQAAVNYNAYSYLVKDLLVAGIVVVVDSDQYRIRNNRRQGKDKC